MGILFGVKKKMFDQRLLDYSKWLEQRLRLERMVLRELKNE